MLSRREILASGSATVVLAGCGHSSTPEADASLLPVIGFAEAEPSSNKANTEPRIAVQLGNSVDSVTDDVRGLLASGKSIETDVSPDDEYRQNSLQWKMIEDQSEYHARIRSSAKAKTRLGIFKGKGGGSTSKIEAKSSYSLSINCVALRYAKAITFDGRPAIDKEVAKFLAQNRGKNGKLLTQLGDSYVHAVVPANALFLEVLFQTRSRSKLKELQASVAASFKGLGSGGGNFAQIIGTASSHKELEIRALGVDGSDIITSLKAEEVSAALKRFFADDTRPKFANCVYRPVRTLIDNGAPLTFANETEWRARERFATRVMEALDILDDARVDATYVTRNPDEFDVDTLRRATDDLPVIGAAALKIRELGEDVFDAFASTGVTDSSFDRGRVDALLPALKEYIQKEPTPPPPPPPRRRPQADADRGRNDHGMGGLGGTR